MDPSRIIHLNGFSQDELRSKRPLILRNILESVVQLIEGAQTIGLTMPMDRTVSTLVKLGGKRRSLHAEQPVSKFGMFDKPWPSKVIALMI